MHLAHCLDNFVEAISPNASLFAKAQFSETSSSDIEPRFEVYRNSYNATLNRALTQIYPVIRLIVGEACFNRMAEDFIELYPSLSVDLNSYGQHFSDFIEGQVSGLQAFSDLPYLSDLAKLEYAWHDAYFAEDETEFPFDLFANNFEQADCLILTLNPSLQYFSTSFPLTEIWQSHKQGIKLKSIEQSEATYYVAIMRVSDHISVSNITHELFQLLYYSQQGETLAFIAEQYPAGIQQLTFAIEQKYITEFSTLVSSK